MPFITTERVTTFGKSIGQWLLMAGFLVIVGLTLMGLAVLALFILLLRHLPH